MNDLDGNDQEVEMGKNGTRYIILGKYDQLCLRIGLSSPLNVRPYRWDLGSLVPISPSITFYDSVRVSRHGRSSRYGRYVHTRHSEFIGIIACLVIPRGCTLSYILLQPSLPNQHLNLLFKLVTVICIVAISMVILAIFFLLSLSSVWESHSFRVGEFASYDYEYLSFWFIQ